MKVQVGAMPFMLGASPKSLRLRAFEALRLDRALLATGIGFGHEPKAGHESKLRLSAFFFVSPPSPDIPTPLRRPWQLGGGP